MKMSRNVLSAKARYQVQMLVKDTYTLSQSNDEDFARDATKTLGFPVSGSHISSARQVLDIQSNYISIRGSGFEARIRKLENDVQSLVARLNVYCSGSR
jgi:hypothetical protein